MNKVKRICKQRMRQNNFGFCFSVGGKKIKNYGNGIVKQKLINEQNYKKGKQKKKCFEAADKRHR